MQKEICDHQCRSDCRREGCNCICGEWHVENCEKCEKNKATVMGEEDDLYYCEKCFQEAGDRAEANWYANKEENV